MRPENVQWPIRSPLRLRTRVRCLILVPVQARVRVLVLVPMTVLVLVFLTALVLVFLTALVLVLMTALVLVLLTALVLVLVTALVLVRLTIVVRWSLQQLSALRHTQWEVEHAALGPDLSVKIVHITNCPAVVHVWRHSHKTYVMRPRLQIKVHFESQTGFQHANPITGRQ